MAEKLPRIPCACGELRRSARLVTQLYDRHLRPSGLRATQFSILYPLSTTGPQPTGRLARWLGLDATTMSRTTATLEKMGLLTTESRNDGRQRWLTLTTAGAERVQAAIPLWETAQAELQARLGPERWETVTSALTDVARRMS